MTMCNCGRGRHKRIWIQVRLDVAVMVDRQSSPWIFIFVPSSGNLSVLLVDSEGVVLEMLLELVGHQKTRRAGSNAYHFDMSFGMNRTFEPAFHASLAWSRGGDDEISHDN
jgi:hypothetical protein